MRKLLTVILILGSIFNLSSQSLKADTAVILDQLDIAESLVNNNPDSSEMLYNDCFRVSEEMGFVKGQVMSLLNIGYIYYYKGKIDSCLHLMARASELQKMTIDHELTYSLLNNIGYLKKKKGDVSGALNDYRIALHHTKLAKDSAATGTVLNNIGKIFESLGSSDSMFYYVKQSIEIRLAIDDKKGVAGSYHNLASYHAEKGDYKKAMLYLEKSLALKKEINDLKGIAESLNDIGHNFAIQKEYEMAKVYYLRSFEMYDSLGNNSGRGLVMNNLGDLMVSLKELKEAERYFKKAIEIKKTLDVPGALSVSLLNLAGLINEGGAKEESLNYYEEGLKYARLSNDAYTIIGALLKNAEYYYEEKKLYKAKSLGLEAVELLKGLESLYYEARGSDLMSKIYQSLNEFENAFLYMKKARAAYDSLNSQENKELISNMAAKYEADKKEAAFQLLLKEKKVQDIELKRKNLQRNALFGGIGVLLCFMLFGYKAYRSIGFEKKRSESLLLNILPGKIAAELKEKGKAVAKHHKEVSVLFTDFKGFTYLSEQLSPEDLVDEIDYCYREFDAIVQKYGVEKIKTIGDAYMAAGGVPEYSSEMVKKTVKAAIEIRDFMLVYAQERKKEEKPYFEIRIGIHTGPLVAGVVGSNKFAYDIWGDTVNLAARMESSGDVGKVNVSEHVKRLIEDEGFLFENRGKVKAKNKGELQMFFVEESKEINSELA